jgi:hypothetical protein
MLVGGVVVEDHMQALTAGTSASIALRKRISEQHDRPFSFRYFTPPRSPTPRIPSPIGPTPAHPATPISPTTDTSLRWRKDYRRQIKISARPIVILQPMGPILFVFDVSDTAPLPNARPLPPQVEDPFQVRNGKIGGQLGLTTDNSKRDGVPVSERADGSQRAGSIQWAAAGQHLEFSIAKKPLPKSTQVPLWFELLLNSVHSAEARYGTLVHELAHLYCGHLERRMVDGGQIGEIYRMTFLSLGLNPSVIWFAPGSASTRRPTNTSLPT